MMKPPRLVVDKMIDVVLQISKEFTRLKGRGEGRGQHVTPSWWSCVFQNKLVDFKSVHVRTLLISISFQVVE